MNLAVNVAFWDAGPEAIGEDMHMYLKCFFNTQGRVIVKSIYSPISSCNITGSGSGFPGYISGILARYTQSKRHLWGSLDTGYVFCRSLLSIIAPESQCTVPLKNNAAYPQSKDFQTIQTIPTKLMFQMFHRMLESHILMGQFLPLVIAATFCLPTTKPSPYDPFASLKVYLWSLLSNMEIHPVLEFALELTAWLRFLCIIPAVISWYYYEK
jgi:hypothetical protein